jgi:hypothetical protein
MLILYYRVREIRQSCQTGHKIGILHLYSQFLRIYQSCKKIHYALLRNAYHSVYKASAVDN